MEKKEEIEINKIIEKYFKENIANEKRIKLLEKFIIILETLQLKGEYKFIQTICDKYPTNNHQLIRSDTYPMS